MNYKDFQRDCEDGFCNYCKIYDHCQTYFANNVLKTKEFGSRKHFDGIIKLMRKQKLEKLLS